MKKIIAMLVAAMMALSFSMVAFAEEKKEEKTEKVEKVEKKDAKKDKKKDEKKKDADAKPAAKGKKEVSGC
jgi:uncharacterized protein HemX